MQKVKPKKHLGQHFLADESIAKRIADSYLASGSKNTLEIGSGMGVLTKYLQPRDLNFHLSEIDTESIQYLKIHFPDLKDKIIEGDVLHQEINVFGDEEYGIVGNFPYNISSQIFFKVLDNREKVVEVVGMLQKEVAARICSKEGNKVYGILSVLLQAFYDAEYLFEVPPDVFIPPPKVNSAVLRLTRKENIVLDCDEKFLFTVVKLGFGTRRKTLRNALKSLNLPDEVRAMDVFSKRAEQLSVQQFIELTKLVKDSLL